MAKKKGFGKHENATRMRDAIAKVVRSQLDIHRPTDRVGTVIALDPVQGEVTVIFPGDDDAQLVSASKLMMPSALDDLVRVAGVPGAYYVTDIVEGDPWVSAWGGAVGDMKFWPAVNIPEAAENIWLPCDGRVMDAADYPKLYAVLADSYAGSSGTLFTLPDFRRRFPRGTDGAGGTTWEPGNDEGQTTVSNRAINHSHGITASSDHTHGISGSTGSGGSHSHAAGSLAVTTGAVTVGGAGSRGINPITGDTGNEPGHTHGNGSLANADNGAHSHGGSTNNTSTGDFPYLIVNYLIKVV